MPNAGCPAFFRHLPHYEALQLYLRYRPKRAADAARATGYLALPICDAFLAAVA